MAEKVETAAMVVKGNKGNTVATEEMVVPGKGVNPMRTQEKAETAEKAVEAVMAVMAVTAVTAVMADILLFYIPRKVFFLMSQQTRQMASVEDWAEQVAVKEIPALMAVAEMAAQEIPPVWEDLKEMKGMPALMAKMVNPETLLQLTYFKSLYDLWRN